LPVLQLLPLHGLRLLRLGRVGRFDFIERIRLPDLAPLSCLTALHTLELGSSARLPPTISCLSQLSVLRLSRVYDFPDIGRDPRAVEAACSRLGAVLQPLTALTVLQLQSVPYMPGLACIASMPLQRFAWQGSMPGKLGLRDPTLPAGLWLEHVRWLEAPASILVHNLETLSAAQQLQHVAALGCGKLSTTQQLDLLRWAQTLPALRSLLLDGWQQQARYEGEPEGEDPDPYGPSGYGRPELYKKVNVLMLDSAVLCLLTCNAPSLFARPRPVRDACMVTTGAGLPQLFLCALYHQLLRV